MRLRGRTPRRPAPGERKMAYRARGAAALPRHGPLQRLLDAVIRLASLGLGALRAQRHKLALEATGRLTIVLEDA
jgi:hypothetical protein